MPPTSGFTVSRVLDAGCGLGHFRVPVREIFPRARYVGLETSDYLCRRFGWVQASIAGYAPKEGFDLLFCHDVLQYLDDKSAVRALANLGRLSRGALYFSVLTAEDWRRNADRARTDSGVRLRPAAWYKTRLLRHFRPVGGGLLVRRGFDPLLWELERPWTKGS
jgi:SAM-dependent methyltransferase